MVIPLIDFGTLVLQPRMLEFRIKLIATKFNISCNGSTRYDRNIIHQVDRPERVIKCSDARSVSSYQKASASRRVLA